MARGKSELTYQSKIKEKLSKYASEGNLEEFRSLYDRIYAIDEVMARSYLTGKYDSRHSMLHSAAMGRDDNKEMMNWLIANGVSLDLQDSKGRTPLIFAVDRGKVKNVKYLLDNFADVTKTEYNGNTALHVACEPNDHSEEIVRLLMNHTNSRVSVNSSVKNNKGATPLHIAARFGNIDAIKAMFEIETGGLDLDGLRKSLKSVDEDGDTPLHYAAMDEAGTVAKFLLGVGADKKVKNKEGKIPFEIAQEWDPDGETAYVLKLDFSDEFSGRRGGGAAAGGGGDIFSRFLVKYNEHKNLIRLMDGPDIPDSPFEAYSTRGKEGDVFKILAEFAHSHSRDPGMEGRSCRMIESDLKEFSEITGITKDYIDELG